MKELIYLDNAATTKVNHEVYEAIKEIGPFIYGGAQERSRRAGTHNTPGTVGNAKCGDIMRMYLDIDDNGVLQISRAPYFLPVK